MTKTLHTLFPTFVLQNENKENEKFKEIFFEKAMNYFTPEGVSQEQTGHVNLHHDENFYPIFKFVTENAKMYLKELKIDPELYDYNIVKSWLNVTKTVDNPLHHHSDAHLSFSYYLNIPKELDKHIRFEIDSTDHPNSLYSGLLDMVQEYNYLNFSVLGFSPDEGTIFVFPANLKHSVVDVKGTKDRENGVKNLEHLKTYRICIAGDFLLTFKEKQPVPLGLQPVKNWRTF